MVVFMSVFIAGCSSQDEVMLHQEEIPSAQNETRINAENALLISDRVLGRVSTRSASEMCEISYVTDFIATRAEELCPDTLAYVINYPDNKGFVIVSSYSCVYPVLAFSREGKFDFKNEIAEKNFINNIKAYLEEADGLKVYDVTDHDFDSCYAVEPMVLTSLNQGDPWNKYVIQNHPDCPVGCVAVATCVVMSHSKRELNYHGSNFKLKSIVEAISNGPEQILLSDNDNKNAIFMPPLAERLPTYNEAVDSISKILYWIGIDVDMNYTPSGSGALSSKAYDLCKSLGFNIPSNYADFDIKEIVEYLNSHHIVYLRGADIDGKGGHAWIADGCYYCVDLNDKAVILDAYIHCDWGWGGSCNGYYSGSVFSASVYNFKPQNYFAVKREWDLFSSIK